MLWLLSWQEGLDDAHAATAARARKLGCFWLFGLSACRSLGAGVLDGIDRDEWYCEELADTRDIAGAGLACEKAVVADAVKALRQHVHQETADELVGIERHLLVPLGTFGTVILPPEGDALVVERDQAARSEMA